jgi:hypothetical protein
MKEPRGMSLSGHFYRDYCASCEEPIRVSEKQLEEGMNFCHKCDRSVIPKRSKADSLVWWQAQKLGG